MAVLSEMESKARDLLSSVDLSKLSISEIRVRNVFWVMWSSSLPGGRIQVLSAAIEGEDLQSLGLALNSMVRRGILRTRDIAGVKHYELAL